MARNIFLLFGCLYSEANISCIFMTRTSFSNLHVYKNIQAWERNGTILVQSKV